MKKSSVPANKGKTLVSFSLDDAQRINSVVSMIEGARRGRKPSVLPRAFSGGSEPFRVCTFAGSWAKNTEKTVTLKYQTTETVTAVNLFAEIGTAASSRNCAIAREGTAWFLIAAEC